MACIYLPADAHLQHAALFGLLGQYIQLCCSIKRSDSTHVDDYSLLKDSEGAFGAMGERHIVMYNCCRMPWQWGKQEPLPETDK